eukprot:3688807-Rhodomonas_salina.1
MQDVTQTVDMAHCKMPDFYMSDVYHCACCDAAAMGRDRTLQSRIIRPTKSVGIQGCPGRLRQHTTTETSISDGRIRSPSLTAGFQDWQAEYHS